METDRDGLIKIDSLEIAPFATLREALQIAISAQHQANVEAVRLAAPLDSHGLVSNKEYIKGAMDMKAAILAALKAEADG